MLSLGAAGRWYFEWFAQNYPHPITRHIAIELGSKPDDLPHEVEWIQGDASDLSAVPDQSIDLVFAGQFIEHIGWEQQANLLVEVNRVLRPDGWFVLDSPDHSITNRYGWRHPEHIHELTFEQIAVCLLRSGFRIYDAIGLVSRDQLGPPPGSTKSCVIAGQQFEALAEREGDIHGHPGDSFVWWVVAQRSAHVGDRVAVGRLVEEFYVKNMAERLHVVHSQVGQLITHRESTFVQSKTGLGAGALLYGPFDVYPAGRYIVTFELWLTDLNEDIADWHAPICEIDVAAGPEGTILARRSLSATTLLELGSRELEFAIQEPTMLQFRVIWAGQQALAAGITPSVERTDGRLSST